jgi:hypothetical protein
VGALAGSNVTEIAPSRSSRRLRWQRPVLLAVSVVLLGLLVAEMAIAYLAISRDGDLWIDYVFYRDVGRSWLEGGSYYLPRQLTGEPYDVALMVDVLYPPHALFLFVPLAFLPAILWWLVPIAILAVAIVGWRPAMWTWPIMILLFMWPRANAAFLFGNTDMWMAAAVAAGLRWGWPAIALTLKPTLLPLAFIGARTRAWWIALVVLGLVSLAMLPLWIDYLTAMRTVSVGLDYSLGSLPLLLIPVVAWLGRRRDDRLTSPSAADEGARDTPAG